MRAKATTRFSPLVLIIILVTGIVFGGIITYLTKNMTLLAWLNIGYEFGLKEPVILDMYILKLTFGIGVNINVAVIFGIAISALGYKFIF
jgi:hypothetical protein